MSAPHSSRLARLPSGAFYCVVSLLTLCEVILYRREKECYSELKVCVAMRHKVLQLHFLNFRHFSSLNLTLGI
jgi:hypothetical protein